MIRDARHQRDIDGLVDALGAVIWEFDWSTGAFTYVSEGAQRLLGHPREAWLEPGFWVAHLHPDDVDWAPQYCQCATEDGLDHTFDYRMLHADGHYVWLRDVVTVDAEKRMAGSLRGILLDISAEKTAEARAARHETIMTRLFDGMEMHALGVEPDGTIVYANQAVARFHGRPVEEMIGRNFAEFTPADQLGSLEQGHRANISGAPERAPSRFELVDSAGERRVLRGMRSSISLPDDTLPTMFVIAEDVTDQERGADEAARKAAEFDAVFEMLKDLYFRVDADGTVLDHKSAAVSDKLYVPPSEFIGRRMVDVLPPDVSALLRAKLRHAMKTRHMVIAEYSLTIAGVVGHWEARILPLDDDEAAIICRDVTKRHDRELALRESEQRYRALVEFAPYGILVFGLDQRIRFANRAAITLFEAETFDDLFDMKAKSFYSPNTNMALVDAVGDFSRRLSASHGRDIPPPIPPTQTGVTTMRGHVIDLEQSVAAISFEGEPAVLVMLRDVTSELRAEREVRESRDFLERLLGLIDSGVVLIDGASLRLTLANGPAERIFGYPEGGLSGVSIAELDASSAEAESFESVVTEPLASGELHSSERVLRRKDGTPFDAEVTVRGLGDRPDRLAVVRDVSDRKAAERLLRESERRFRQVVDQAPLGMHLYELRGDGAIVLIDANPAADVVFGREHDGLLGRPIEEVAGNIGETALPGLLARIAEEGGSWSSELAYESARTGQLRTLEVTAFQTAPRQVSVMFRDVSEKAEAAQTELRHKLRLQALTAQLAQTEDRERRQLAEELHDRVSQALAVARMQLRQAASGSGPVDAGQVLHATELLDDAIRETRALTTELFPPVLFELGLPAALRWVCDEMERQHELACSSDIADLVLPLSDEAKALVFRAARELLVNVVKHAGTGAADIRLSERGHEVELVVSDCGRGITEPGGHDATSGFGLFSVRERVEQMGGTLDIVSEKDKGTTVTLRIPASL